MPIAMRRSNEAAGVASQRGTIKLTVSEAVLQDVVARLRRVEGQVKALQRMLIQREDCHRIAQQMAAARAALQRATVTLVLESMADCMRAGAYASQRKRLARMRETFSKLL